MRFIVQKRVNGTLGEPDYWLFESQWPTQQLADIRANHLGLLGMVFRVVEIALVRTYPIAV